MLVGVAFPVDPGSHEISARQGEITVSTRQITLAEGELREVDLELSGHRAEPEGATPDETPEGLGTAEPDPDGESARPGRSVLRQWWFWTIIGAVVVGGVVTAGVLATEDNDELPHAVGGLNETFYVGGDR